MLYCLRSRGPVPASGEGINMFHIGWANELLSIVVILDNLYLMTLLMVLLNQKTSRMSRESSNRNHLPFQWSPFMSSWSWTVSTSFETTGKSLISYLRRQTWTHWRKYLRWRQISNCNDSGKRLDSLLSPSKQSPLMLHWASPSIQIVGDKMKNNHSSPRGRPWIFFFFVFWGDETLSLSLCKKFDKISQGT